MKRFLILISIVAIAISTSVASDLDEAHSLAARLSPQLAQKIQFELITASGNGNDIFSIESRDGKVVIGGNNANSEKI